MKTALWISENLHGNSESCIFWPFAKNEKGVGVVRRDGRLHKASRYVCELFNGPPVPPRVEAAHTCGNGHLSCVNPNHLEWKSKIENEADKLKHGTRYMGEGHHFSKLSKADVYLIFELRNRGFLQGEIADEVGVCQSQVSQILSGKRWNNTIKGTVK